MKSINKPLLIFTLILIFGIAIGILWYTNRNKAVTPPTVLNDRPFQEITTNTTVTTTT